jgi:sacsin
MHTEKWLHTSHGFRTPDKCALFDCSWEPVIPVASLPFIDDSDFIHGTGKKIYSYKKELKALGVAVDLNHGADILLSSLAIDETHEIPIPNGLHPCLSLNSTLVALLKCMQLSVHPRKFAEEIRKMQIKTTLGYRYADGCILYDSTWSSYFHMEDGPFIDVSFHGPDILSYRTELKMIGVALDVGSGCSLMALNLKSFSRTDTISRIYRYFAAFKWEPKKEGENWIWIPKGRSSGQWVSPGDCVLHDRSGLFSVRFNVLDNYYEKDLFPFFSTAFHVRHSPRVLDHCILWRSWECTSFELRPASCSFWEFIGSHWNTTTANLLSGSVTRVPVLVNDKIVLREVEDVFVPDDLLLKHLFDQFSSNPMFVWYPTGLSFVSRAKMDIIYQSLGVRSISKAVIKDESFLPNLSSCQVVETTDTTVTPGFLRIILAFLANPVLEIASEKRHQMVSCLPGTKGS